MLKIADRTKMESEKKIDFVALLQAVKDCLLDKKGIRPTARAYNFPKSTLERHLKKIQSVYSDISNVSNNDLMNLLKINHMRLPSNMV